jgi:hypothetical protein
MTSYYNQIPTLAMRARAAVLIVVGKVGRALRTDVEQHEGKSYQRTTYEVSVERVLKGKLGEGTEQHTIAVQVLGGEAAHDASPKDWVAPPGAELLLMLSEGILPGTYVPYLGSAFPISADGYLQLGDHAAEKIGLLGATKSDGRGIDLQAVVRLVEEAVSEEAEAGEHHAVAPGPVTEMPVGHEGGGKHATPLGRHAAEGGAPNESAPPHSGLRG